MVQYRYRNEMHRRNFLSIFSGNVLQWTMLDVFQATPFVHIGADEVGGVPQEAQRDFINRINAFVRGTGRRTVVWEGPSVGEGAGKVSEDVIQMAWEGRYVPLPELVAAGTG